MKKDSSCRTSTALTSWFLLLYFLILFAERAQSVIRSLAGGFSSLYQNGFAGYVNTLTVLSLLATIVLLAGFNRDFWKSLSGSCPPNYLMISITAGVLLLSGMVHTEYTIAPIQFVSYGMLIVAMIIRTVETSAQAENSFRTWYSLAYLILFAMAVPVVYETHIALATLFHVIEAVTAIVLVLAFTCMTARVFVGKAENLLQWTPFIIAVVADALVLFIRWQEEINFFVLIFILLTIVAFIVGKILFRTPKNKQD